jgi:hypothetical protein
MTNYKQVKGNKKRGGNRKDGNRPDRRQTKAQRKADEDAFLAAGFGYQWIRGAPRLTYTCQGEFPVFEVCPGITTDDTGTHAGLVAKHAQSGKEILFDYGTSPAIIAARLDGEILAIMRHDADVDGPPIDWVSAGEWVDIDQFMAAEVAE